MPSKSPPWVREEIILALDLYVRNDRRVPDDHDPAVILLSHHLNQMTIHPMDVRAANFRNPNGVALKIANLRAFDPSTTSQGMSGGSRLDKAISEEFQDNPRGLHAAAADIRLRFGLGGSIPEYGNSVTERRVAEEQGRFETTLDQLSIHERLERDVESGAARKAAAASLTCEVCGFDFQRTYGERGAGYIQFHHRAPLRDLTEQTRPSPADLHMICANCHTMLHAGDEPITLAELKAIVREVQRAGIRELADLMGPPPA